MGRNWHGGYVKKARRIVAATLPAPCWRCGIVIQPGDPFTVGHIIDADIAPHLEHDPSNWAAEHPKCNYSAGATAGNRKRGRSRTRRAVTSRDW